ncbi:phosphoribosyltransferase [Pyrofollis japonicus]|uniref:phosphoribosyltransferase n=1 Tax=Pyrofollis japonicus TaxID=3060460 RepID=UPI00295A989C|nr:phosphoribosyltransferase [Pyrofollis japonicus]BEP18259.1 phosphoribosyltransferase [Pyrofollis japonicus]
MPRVPVKLVSWNEIVEWSRGLARKIKESGYKPTVVIAVARGGYVPARLLCDFLGVENLLSIQSQHWTEAAKAAERAVIKFPYKVDLRGHRALLVDDIVDTGETLLLAKDYVLSEWKPDDLKIAALQWISTVAKFKPDYYFLEVKEWTWFQYPWTRLEDVTQFIKRMITETYKETGKDKWTYKEIIEGFKEWYGVEVEEFYYRDAIEMLIEKGVISVCGEDTYCLAKKD